MRLVICDDDPTQIESLKAKVMQFAGERGVYTEIATFPSAEAFLFDYSENRNVDILLLDIEMGAMNGVELARELRKDNEAIQIVFITGFPDYISDGYDVAALHYLMKPVKTDKLFEVLTRAVEAVASKPHFFLLPVGKEVVRVRERDILYAEAQGHYMHLHTTSGEHKLRMTIGELSDRLGDGFFKCSRSFLVGLAHVSRITKTTVVLDDASELPLAKGLHEPLGAALIQYVRTM